MAIAATPQQTVSITANAAALSQTFAIASAPAGSILFFQWGAVGASVGAMSGAPSCPNTTWVPLIDYFGTRSGFQERFQQWLGVVLGGSTGTVFTVTGAQLFSLGNVRGTFAEWRGCYPTPYLAGYALGSSTAFTIPPATPTTGKNALIVTGARSFGASGALASGPSGTFTDPAISGSAACRFGYRVVAAAAGPYPSVWTWDTSVNWIASSVVFYDTIQPDDGRSRYRRR